MKFRCEACGRSYVADEQVRGRAFKMKCRQCGALIVIGRESTAHAVAAEASLALAVPVVPSVDALPPPAPVADGAVSKVTDMVLTAANSVEPPRREAAQFAEEISPDAATAVEASAAALGGANEAELAFAELGEEMIDVATSTEAPLPIQVPSEPTPTYAVDAASAVAPAPRSLPEPEPTPAFAPPGRAPGRAPWMVGAIVVAVIGIGAYALLHGGAKSQAPPAPARIAAAKPPTPTVVSGSARPPAAPAATPAAIAAPVTQPPVSAAMPAAAMPAPAAAAAKPAPDPVAKHPAPPPESHATARGKQQEPLLPRKHGRETEPVPAFVKSIAPSVAASVAARPAPPPARVAAVSPTPEPVVEPAEPGIPPNTHSIDAVVTANARLFRACVADARKNEPQLELAGRRVEIFLTVNPTGKALYPTIDDVQLRDTQLGQCLKSAGSQLRFPAFDGPPARVRVPLVLGR